MAVRLISFHKGALIFLIVFSLLSLTSKGQFEKILPDSVTIEQCLGYAMKNQPMVKQLKLDEEIADQNIRISLSDWLPQVNSGAGYQFYLKQPVSIFPNLSDPAGPKIPVTLGVKYNSSLQLSASQNLFTNDLYFAGRAAKYYRQQAKQTTRKELVQLVIDVSKSFYDVLLSEQMLKIIDEDIDRLSKSLNDAYALYKTGATDRIDYSRATISLNSVRSQRIGIINSIKSKLVFLKQLMGYPEDKPLYLKYDFNSMKQDILIDTLQGLPYKDRIEYQLLQTNIRLQKLSINYYKQSILPSLSGFINYNLIYQNDKAGDLYKQSFPNSTAGLTLSFPLFEGTKRLQNLKKSKLSYERLVLDTINLKNEMGTGYYQALAQYKSNLASYNITLQNIDIAHDIYNTVMYQYKQGIKTYLEVIISETDLLTAQINNLSALISLMYSKIDVQQALGKISVNY
jgi:outer membrane protein TolC